MSWFEGNVWISSVTKISLITVSHAFFYFSQKNEHDYRVSDVFKKSDKLSVFLNYITMLRQRE